MVVITDKGETIKLTEPPRWSEIRKCYFAWGFRLVKSRGAYSAKEALHSFKSYTEQSK